MKLNSLEITDKKETLKLRCKEIINTCKMEIREMTDDEEKEFNDNKEELDKWFEWTVKVGIKSIVLDVEGGWYINNKFNISDELYELLEYAGRRADELGMKNVEYYDRANDRRIHKDEYKKLRENEQVN